MKKATLLLIISLVTLNSCDQKAQQEPTPNNQVEDSLLVEQPEPVSFDPAKIEIEKAFLYDDHTLEDTYPYKDTVRVFQWDKIRKRLALLDSIESVPASWAILQNYKNKNGEAPLVKVYKRDSYKRISDTLGVERYQSVPLFLPTDSAVAEIYGRDGSLVKLINNDSSRLVKITTVDMKGEWLVPQKYIKAINDTIIFRKAIFIDLTNQNIATLEKVDSKWLVRSMNPATTGLHKPPHMQETPKGIFVIQEKKSKMVYLVDGSQETGGFAPYASRFSNGGYIHGVPVNAPSTKIIEFSPSLGTTPRSHMCVRNATSHAKFIYDWASTEQTLVFIFD
ncbi:L,D-transpeptidase-like protein [Dysgonomonas alginatilytica]|uniref:L,D-transpeptidase-like protein n=1 Tax=Dysgonomonas alginatilytica TaxID=1605892 RepID=A0A2V3PPR5_9BACT|nr:L,D-transpeptidase [Dysgonomonas alginatilytica]PXV65109.1 L,D-transpeptidase-like protein [Dysgonomonas alginatilytica]